MNLGRVNRKLEKQFGGKVRVREEKDRIVVSGRLDSWQKAIKACGMCVDKKGNKYVVNDIKVRGITIPPMRVPKLLDDSLEGRKPDVLIIGGGISGASIARELTKHKLDILLVEKEADLAMQASGRNDGEVHPGVDLSRGTRKHFYIRKGNAMYGKLCRQLDVPFDRCGQYVGFTNRWAYPLVWMYAWHRRRVCGIRDTRIIGENQLRQKEPELNPDFRFAIYNPSAGCVCPYGLTIAYGENAVQNGAQISLETAVLDMEVSKGKIISVSTNRGRIYPKLVINAAGVFAEDVARMAEDRFYSIHPRRGTNSILDKQAGHLIGSIASMKELKKGKGHTKGGGMLHTVDDNILVGPDAVETWEKENFATRQDSIDNVFAKQTHTSRGLKKGDIITYFTGVRAPTFEEDFVIERGRRTWNLIHCAGIQSPGLTTAPAVALDVEQMTLELLEQEYGIRAGKNKKYNPVRKGIPRLKELPREERNRLIQENPDYGIIVCRCEEISKGEIIDALHAPLTVPTVDGIKKRLRPGMGRCQGGFCMPLVAKIISEECHIPLSQVKKSGKKANLTYGQTK